MAAIREAVEAKQQSLADIDTDIMDLEDVVWRSPARPVVDPTDIITRLAEEADKVARGVADRRRQPQSTDHVQNRISAQGARLRRITWRRHLPARRLRTCPPKSGYGIW